MMANSFSFVLPPILERGHYFCGGKDLTKSGSYRTNSVLNQDYKIYAAVLAKIMGEILPLFDQ